MSFAIETSFHYIGYDRQQQATGCDSDRPSPLQFRVDGRPSSIGAMTHGEDGTDDSHFHAHRMHGISRPRHFRREYAYEGGGSISSDWICSPVFDGLQALPNVVAGAEGVSSSLGGAHSAPEDLVGSLPYLGSCWFHEYIGNPSIELRMSPMMMGSQDNSSEGLSFEDWDLTKTRSCSIDASVGHAESLSSLVFHMDNVAGPPRYDQHVDTHQHPRGMDIPGSIQDDKLPPQAHFVYVQQPTTAHMPLTSTTPSGNHITENLGWTAPSHDNGFVQPTPGQLTCKAVPFYDFGPQMEQRYAGIPSGPVVGNDIQPQRASEFPRLFQPPASCAKIQLVTKLNTCYWKNGRKNLQCFPICPEHNDFYSMKMNNRKHASVGVCRGPVYCHAFLHAVGRPAASGSRAASLPHGDALSERFHHQQHGTGTTGTGGSGYEVYVLGKFERVPQQNHNDALAELLPPAEDFASAAAFERFRFSCFQAVEMEERRVVVPSLAAAHGSAPPIKRESDQMLTSPASPPIVRSTWFFLPDVWKVQPMLKKKRKATRSAPAQTFPFCFRVFVYARVGAGSTTYQCLASTASTFFELYSTRTVDRVKRKYWGRSAAEETTTGVETTVGGAGEPMTMAATTGHDEIDMDDEDETDDEPSSSTSGRHSLTSTHTLKRPARR